MQAGRLRAEGFVTPAAAEKRSEQWPSKDYQPRRSRPMATSALIGVETSPASRRCRARSLASDGTLGLLRQ